MQGTLYCTCLFSKIRVDGREKKGETRDEFESDDVDMTACRRIHIFTPELRKRTAH